MKGLGMKRTAMSFWVSGFMSAVFLATVCVHLEALGQQSPLPGCNRTEDKQCETR